MKGKVLLVECPYDDLTTTKIRPVTCLTEPVGPYLHVLVAFVTSRRPTDLEETDIVMRLGSPGFNATGLRVDSVVRLDRMISVPIAMILRELGELPATSQILIAVKLRQLFAL